MESGVGAKMKTANASFPVGAALSPPVGGDTHQPEAARGNGRAGNLDKI